MFYKIYKLFSVIVFLFMIITLQAQEVIPASGGNITGNKGSIDYTIGQIVYTTNSGVSGTVAEGVQQPYEIWAYTGVDENNAIQFECSVFPNPVADNLTLKIDMQKLGKLSYQLFESNGKLVSSNNISGNEASVSMKGLSAGTFFLKVIYNSKVVKNFKIIKH